MKAHTQTIVYLSGEELKCILIDLGVTFNLLSQDRKAISSNDILIETKVHNDGRQDSYRVTYSKGSGIGSNYT